MREQGTALGSEIRLGLGQSLASLASAYFLSKLFESVKTNALPGEPLRDNASVFGV